jgi:hypothetical protein
MDLGSGFPLMDSNAPEIDSNGKIAAFRRNFPLIHENSWIQTPLNLV